MPMKSQWLWKSNLNPCQKNVPEKWQTYSDIEMEIIEDAYQEKKERVELDHHIVDLENLLQINKENTTRQRPIKRVSDATLQCKREERFTLPNDNGSNPGNKSFGDESRFLSPKFIEEWVTRNPDLSILEHVDKAVQGILEEGRLVGKMKESHWLAQQLTDVKSKSWDEIALRCIHLYTRECFLYKLVNKSLREEDLSKVDTLGPFCNLLWNSLCSEALMAKYQYKGKVYRGATLTDEEVESYKSSIRKSSKEWHGFSSTSKNRELAEIYGNTLLIINVPSQSQHLDISSISQFPDEDEVLLGASTSFQVEDVSYDEMTHKHHINLRVLW
jgi:hypothetical protein